MAEKGKIKAETEAYLAKIRKTVRDSKDLVEAARLRIEETDRMLASQGVTREEVMSFSFTAEQKEAANAELARRGLPPLEEEAAEADIRDAYAERMPGPGGADAAVRPGASEAGANFTAGDGDGSVENRKRKFNVMMQRFRM